MLEKFEDLVGQILVNIENIDDTDLIFTLGNGDRYMLHHIQDCCEDVYIAEVVGDLMDLIGLPILMAEEAVYLQENPEGAPFQGEDSFTWTFYKLATNRGHATVRWYGSSNGYYSEKVNWIKM